LKSAALKHLSETGEKPTPVKIQEALRPIHSSREIAASLAAIEGAGGRAVYVSCDVTRSKEVRSAVASAAAVFGKVTGLIHGAGMLADRLIEQKTVGDFEAVYSTKVDGLEALLSAVDAKAIKHYVLFSSAAAYFGNPGQADYAIANEILNKVALRLKSEAPAAQVLSLNWGPWDGGMVTPELKRLFEARGATIIPLDGGADLLLRELSASTNRCTQSW
jgi:NAD(P)-dependent dehydrogenase (short-subunit alcohol dehydrogenase family)